MDIKKTILNGILGLFIGCVLLSFSFGIDIAFQTFINSTAGYLLGCWDVHNTNKKNKKSITKKP